VKEDRSSCLDATVYAVITPRRFGRVGEKGTPSISVLIDGEFRVLIDTGSNITILQPGKSQSEVRLTDMQSYGVTGKILDVKGRQAVSFVLGKREFNYQFLVCCPH